LLDKVTVEAAKLGSSTYFFEPPVVLYSKLRPYLNKVYMPSESGYATTELVPLYCDQKKILPTFLLSLLRSKNFVEFANTNSGGAKMPRVIMDKFWDYKITIPSIEEQKRFTAYFNLIEEQKSKYFKAQYLNKAAFASLQHQSFALN